MSLAPIKEHFSRGRRQPSAADFAQAGLVLQTPRGSVTRGDEFVGIVTEFGVVDEVYDKKAGRMLHGSFLVQWTDIDGETLHHTYSRTRGRPPGASGPRLAPEDATKPRSVRLNEARWEKLQRLGRGWLEAAIDRAEEPADAGGPSA